MLFSYGPGKYQQGARQIAGQILLSEHKLFLRGPEGDLTQTYIPLEKIGRIKKGWGRLTIWVRPSLIEHYTVELRGRNDYLTDLTRELVDRRALRKRFWSAQWEDPDL